MYCKDKMAGAGNNHLFNVLGRLIRGDLSTGWVISLCRWTANITWPLESDSNMTYIGIMKTTVDIPESELAEAMAFTKARTKREAIVTALMDFNRRRRMAALVRHAGTCRDLMNADEIKALRRKG
jgi:hypothetical protein